MIDVESCIEQEMSGKARVTISLEPEIYQWLSERAKQEGRPLANLVGYLVTATVKAEAEKGRS